MVLQVFWFVFGLVITVSIIAIGAYIGTLRALDTFYGDGFLLRAVPRATGPLITPGRGSRPARQESRRRRYTRRSDGAVPR